jgi:hypothetical protein
MAAADASRRYAENLRQSLIAELFEGEEDGAAVLDSDGPGGSVDDYLGLSNDFSLEDVDRDLDEYQDHELIKGLLERVDVGRVITEYSRDIDDKLRQAEIESIQEYIQESDNMVALHDQVILGFSGCRRHACMCPEIPASETRFYMRSFLETH